jgi:hypothetical protein
MTIHEDLAGAWRQRGLNVVSVEPVSGKRSAPNPTAITLQMTATKTITYQLFAWNVTHEGKGRTGNNLRIQATSFGKDNSPRQVDQSVLCVGWSGDHGVYVGFDPWVKRNPGGSSSVHIRRELVEEAQQAGLVYGGYAWDPRIAFTVDNAEALIPWASNLWNQRTLSVKAVRADFITPDRLVIEVDPWSSSGAWGVRVGDRLGVFDAQGNHADAYLWRVETISEEAIPLDSGNNRFHYVFTADKSAKVTGQLEQP